MNSLPYLRIKMFFFNANGVFIKRQTNYDRCVFEKRTRVMPA